MGPPPFLEFRRINNGSSADYALLNCFSSIFLVSSMATGRPWGQYFTSPDITASATRASSWGLVFQPPLIAALQAMVCSKASLALDGSARPVDSRVWASSPSALSTSAGST